MINTEINSIMDVMNIYQKSNEHSINWMQTNSLLPNNLRCKQGECRTTCILDKKENRPLSYHFYYKKMQEIVFNVNKLILS